MTTAATMPPCITVRALAALLREWPRRGVDGRPTVVLLGSRHADLGALPLPALTAGALELDQSGRLDLILHPKPLTARPVADDRADALDLALAALAYQTTPLDEYDPLVASDLTCRAVTAIQAVKSLEGRLSL